MTTTLREIDLNLLVVLRDLMQTRSISAVSYTHLTLPTKRIV